MREMGYQSENWEVDGKQIFIFLQDKHISVESYFLAYSEFVLHWMTEIIIKIW